jgi:penicillin amidase
LASLRIRPDIGESIKYLSPELRAALEAYARGVNAYIATLDDKTLPAEFQILRYKPREWRPADSIVVGKILADGLSSTWRNDLIRASVQGMDKDKFADLTNQVTPYDVVLFGKDVANAERGMRNAESADKRDVNSVATTERKRVAERG